MINTTEVIGAPVKLNASDISRQHVGPIVGCRNGVTVSKYLYMVNGINRPLQDYYTDGGSNVGWIPGACANASEKYFDWEPICIKVIGSDIITAGIGRWEINNGGSPVYVIYDRSGSNVSVTHEMCLCNLDEKYDITNAGIFCVDGVSLTRTDVYIVTPSSPMPVKQGSLWEDLNGNVVGTPSATAIITEGECKICIPEIKFAAVGYVYNPTVVPVTPEPYEGFDLVNSGHVFVPGDQYEIFYEVDGFNNAGMGSGPNWGATVITLNTYGDLVNFMNNEMIVLGIPTAAIFGQSIYGVGIASSAQGAPHSFSNLHYTHVASGFGIKGPSKIGDGSLIGKKKCTPVQKFIKHNCDGTLEDVFYSYSTDGVALLQFPFDTSNGDQFLNSCPRDSNLDSFYEEYSVTIPNSNFASSYTFTGEVNALNVWNGSNDVGKITLTFVNPTSGNKIAYIPPGGGATNLFYPNEKIVSAIFEVPNVNRGGNYSWYINGHYS